MRSSPPWPLILGSILFIAVLSCSAPSGRIIAPPAMIQGAEPVGMETCAGCHEEKAREFENTAHGRYLIRGEEGEEVMACESCHGQGSLHLEVGGGVGQYIINPSENPEPCFQCHAQVQVAFNLEYHHPVREERLTCTNCHDPHGEIYLARGMRMGRENAVCRQCHKEKTRPRVFVHEALREGCTVCHRPHGSINDKLLVENDSNLCLKCHAQLSTPGTVLIGGFSHTTRLAEGTCWNAGCHTAVHGSDINPHLRY